MPEVVPLRVSVCASRPRSVWPKLFAIHALAGLLLCVPQPGRSHPIVSTDINRYVELTVRSQRVEVDYLYEMLEIAAIAAAREADSDHDGRTSEAEHEAQFRSWTQDLARHLELELDGLPLPLRVIDSERVDAEGVFGLPTTHWRVRLEASLPARGAQGSLVFRDLYRQDLVGWKEIVVHAGDGVSVRGAGASARDRSRGLTDYAAMAELPNPSEQGVTLMLARTGAQASPPPAPAPKVSGRRRAPHATAPQTAATPSKPLPPGAVPQVRSWSAQLRQDAWPFFRLGAYHIATGYDHLLFLLGLLLFRQSLARVVGVVSAFTVAHSMTLALAALGWITPPAATIDVLIALTIAYVGAATLMRPDSRDGPWIAFAFGLVHGFGFAGALREALALRMGTDWLLALASFNLGIEAFQIVAVSLTYPLLRIATRFVWFGALRRLLCLGVMGAGAAWSVARVV